MRLFDILSAQAPEALIPWLEHPTSLTYKLKDASNDAKLILLNQQEVPNAWWLKHHLKVTADTVISREIKMLSHDKPYWYARTFIPKTTYTHNREMFDALSHKTMGALIFGDYGVRRVSGQAYCVDSLSFEYQWAKKHVAFDAESLWVRMAVYETANQHLFYLCEILMPDLINEF